MAINGVILAGGESSRFGENKALYELRDKSFIEMITTVIEPFCDEIILSGDPDSFAMYSFNIIPDEKPNCGPLGGILSTLNYSNTQNHFIVSCDVPFIKTELVSHLINVHNDQYDCTVVESETGIHPLIGIYNKSCIPTIERLLDQEVYRMSHFLDAIKVQIINIADISGVTEKNVANINSKTDLDEWVK